MTECANPKRRSSIGSRRVDRLGKIEVDGTSAVPCLVRNLTERRALIMVRRSAHIPDAVVVVIPEDGFRRAATVRWRRAKSLGVEFAPPLAGTCP